MAKSKRKPKYRRQRRSGRPDLAFVELSGTRLYLGEHGTEESKREYRRLVAEFVTHGFIPPDGVDQITVVELLARFRGHADEYYRRPDGTPTGEAANYRAVSLVAKKLYGRTNVRDFGPRALETVRDELIRKRHARTYVNASIRRLCRIFKWGVGKELVSEGVHRRLQAVEGLRRGRTKARESEPVEPVPLESVEAIQPYVSRQVWAVVQLQLHTGARPGELLAMRPCDLETSGDVWLYQLDQHKTAHHEHRRVIPIGPRAQAVIIPFLKGRALTATFFSPREAEQERRQRLHESRITPRSCGNRPGSNRRVNPKCAPRERYTTTSYGRAVTRACKKAGVSHWHPHQLRHCAGTEFRREFDIETARVVLGH
jgi:integrase